MTEPEVVHPELLAAVRKINAEVAFTMATETTNIITSLLTPEQTMLVLPNGFQVQVIDSIEDIAASPTNIVKKFQYAALIRRERLLLVWHDDLDVILSHAANVEGKLLSLVCFFRSSFFFNQKIRSIPQETHKISADLGKCTTEYRQ
jgi:hypothetical protein